MIEVFKTNVQELSHAKKILKSLGSHFPAHKINFDLHDRDKVLRVEGKNFSTDKVITVVIENGFSCKVLE